MHESCSSQQNLRACNFGQKVFQIFFSARFLLPDNFLIPLDCTIREGWPSLGKRKNDPNHWPKSCLWNLKLHLLGRKIVFWVWVVFFFKTHFQMLTSRMLSYQFGLENRRVGKHFFLSLVGGGHPFWIHYLQRSRKYQELFFSISCLHCQIWLQKKIVQFCEIWRLLSSFLQKWTQWWRSKGRRALLGRGWKTEVRKSLLLCK